MTLQVSLCATPTKGDRAAVLERSGITMANGPALAAVPAITMPIAVVLVPLVLACMVMVVTANTVVALRVVLPVELVPGPRLGSLATLAALAMLALARSTSTMLRTGLLLCFSRGRNKAQGGDGCAKQLLQGMTPATRIGEARDHSIEQRRLHAVLPPDNRQHGAICYSQQGASARRRGSVLGRTCFLDAECMN